MSIGICNYRFVYTHLMCNSMHVLYYKHDDTYVDNG